MGILQINACSIDGIDGGGGCSLGPKLGFVEMSIDGIGGGGCALGPTSVDPKLVEISIDGVGGGGGCSLGPQFRVRETSSIDPIVMRSLA